VTLARFSRAEDDAVRMLVATSPGGMVALQRTVGNRAAIRLLQRQAPAPPAPATPVPTQVSNAISDAPFGWTARYEVRFVGSECLLDAKLRIVPDAGVSAADVTRVQNDTSSEFRRIWDRRFVFTDTVSKTRYVLRVNLVYVTSGEHLTIALHPGSGRDNLSNWYVDSIPTDRAHETGHNLGLKDEYIDVRAATRATATSPGVQTDHSIMGDYYTQGTELAEAKARHGQTIAGHVAAATGKTLTSERPEIAVNVISTEDWTGADEVYAKVIGPGGVYRTPVKSLNDGQSYTFGLTTAPFGDFSKPVIIEVYDEDWPDADDLIVKMAWKPPFGPTSNTTSFDEANYKVTARFG
jgi:hypothetical protein